MMRDVRMMLATVAVLALCAGAPAAAQERQFDLARQPAVKSIPEFARQAGIQIVAPADQLNGVTTPEIRGAQDARAALRQLIAGTGLEIASDDGATVVLRRSRAVSASDPGEDTAGVIVVTGTRIASEGKVTANPVASIRADAIVGRYGGISIGDQLSLLPQFRTTFTQASSTGIGSQAAGQVGLNLLDLRGLGPTRTLVLQNGRRLVSSTQQLSQPDTNTIPVGLLERVDILTGGASAVYGADAIAGVVNFVIKQDYEGLAMNAQAGVSKYGDAGSRNIGLVAGKNFAGGRGNVAISLEYAARDGVGYSNRDFSRGQSDFVNNPNAGQQGQPATIPVQDIRFLSYSNGGTLPYGPPFYRFAPDGTLNPANTGVRSFPNLGISDGGDGYSPIATGSLLPQNERYSGTLLAHFDVSDSVTVFGQFDAIRQTASAQSSPTVETLVLSKDNPYLSAQAQSVLAGYGPTAASPVLVSVRAFDDLGILTEKNTRTTLRGVAGLKGELTPHLRYEVSYSFGSTAVDTDSINNVNRTRIPLAADAVRDTAGVLGSAGAIVCRSRLQAPNSSNPDIAGCVPVNTFGNGAVSPAARDYLTLTTRATGLIQQHLAGGFLAGDTGGFFELPGGAIKFVAGVEFRRETTRYTPDPRDAAGNTLVGGQVTRGSINTYEGYGEINAPLVADVPGIKRLELTASGRVSHYNLSRVGTKASWGVGGLWQPIDDITLRASYQRAVRAPNIAELFQPTVGGVSQITDPCDARFIGNGTPTRRANCAALGIPVTFQAPTIPTTISTLTGGNPNLDVERGTTYSFGGLLEPRFLPGFRLSVDYYNINLKGAIAGANSTLINPFRVPSGCVDAQTLDNPFCPLVTRGANFVITQVAQAPINLTRQTASGIDFDARYAVPLGGRNRIDLRALVSYAISRDDYRSPTQPDFRTQVVETPSNPRWQGTLATNLTLGDFEMSHRLRYFSGVYYKNDDVAFFESVNGLPPSNPNRRSAEYVKTGDAFYQDIRAALKFGTGREFYLGIDNLFDKQPPISIYGAGSVGAQFDSIGRFFYAGIRVAL